MKPEFFDGVTLECDPAVDPLLPNHFKPSLESYVTVCHVSATPPLKM